MSELSHHHVFIPSPSGSARTLLLLHGTGGDERDLLDLGRQLDPLAALLGVRGNTLEGGSPRWFRRLGLGVFDEADLRTRAVDLADFLTAAQAQYGYDPAGLVAVGYSNGANIVAAMLLLHSGALPAAVLLRPTLPLELESTPDLSGRSVFIAAAQRDPYSPRDKVERLAELLRTGGAAVALHWSGGGHELAQGDVVAAREWLAGQG